MPGTIDPTDRTVRAVCSAGLTAHLTGDIEVEVPVHKKANIKAVLNLIEEEIGNCFEGAVEVTQDGYLSARIMRRYRRESIQQLIRCFRRRYTINRAPRAYDKLHLSPSVKSKDLRVESKQIIRDLMAVREEQQWLKYFGYLADADRQFVDANRCATGTSDIVLSDGWGFYLVLNCRSVPEASGPKSRAPRALKKRQAKELAAKYTEVYRKSYQDACCVVGGCYFSDVGLVFLEENQPGIEELMSAYIRLGPQLEDGSSGSPVRVQINTISAPPSKTFMSFFGTSSRASEWVRGSPYPCLDPLPGRGDFKEKAKQMRSFLNGDQHDALQQRGRSQGHDDKGKYRSKSAGPGLMSRANEDTADTSQGWSTRALTDDEDNSDETYGEVDQLTNGQLTKKLGGMSARGMCEEMGSRRYGGHQGRVRSTYIQDEDQFEGSRGSFPAADHQRGAEGRKWRESGQQSKLRGSPADVADARLYRGYANRQRNRHMDQYDMEGYLPDPVDDGWRRGHSQRKSDMYERDGYSLRRGYERDTQRHMYERDQYAAGSGHCRQGYRSCQGHRLEWSEGDGHNGRFYQNGWSSSGARGGWGSSRGGWR